MRSTFRIVRVRGIEIGANWSYVFVFGLITMSLATSFFPLTYEGSTSTAYWAMGLATSVLFVVCLLLHELGHAFRAQKEGMEIEGITLWLLGGVAKFKGTFPSAGAEFRIAIAGPAVTVVLVIVFGVIRQAAKVFGIPLGVTGVVDYLFQINITLLLFNMIPALPLDGGRVLRSAVWAVKRNFLGATLIAANIAKVFAGLIIAAGVFFIATNEPNGVFLALVGFFVIQAGQAEVAYARFSNSVGGRTVGDIMGPPYPIANPSLPVVGVRDPITQAIAAMQNDPLGRAAVQDDDGNVVGLVSLADVAREIEIDQAGALPAQQRRPRFGIALLIAGALMAAGFLITPPYVTFAPGTSFDVTRDITVKGVDVDKVDGEYLLTSVAVQQPNVFGLIGAALSGKELTPLSNVVPPDRDPEKYFEEQETIFREAQQTAAAAAARAAGMDVKLTGKGAEVRSVVDGSPSDGKLRVGDVVVGIAGRDVELMQDLSDVTRTRPAGTSFELDVLRDRRRITVEVESRSGVVEGSPGIGVTVVTKDFSTNLPFEVTFRDREIGGPSAGLAYALAIYDLIENGDLADGRTVGTTGTIDIDGNVGPVGGVEQKTEAATDAGATIFLVPNDEVDEVPRVGDLDVIGVETLEDAIRALR